MEDPDKLTVPELRKALAERGLDTKGLKKVLFNRLKEAVCNQFVCMCMCVCVCTFVM